jgi:hypothetical protein
VYFPRLFHEFYSPEVTPTMKFEFGIEFPIHKIGLAPREFTCKRLAKCPGAGPLLVDIYSLANMLCHNKIQTPIKLTFQKFYL